MAKMYGKAAIESEEQQKLRWQVELEFIQCLANPNYLNFLAQRGYFKDQAFINYLKYLQYWKEPEYAKYIMYPLCLYFLDLLQYEHFRREIVNSQCCKFIDDQIILHWQHYTRKRTKLLSAFSNANSKNGANGTQETNDTQQVQLSSSQPANSSNSNSGHTTQQHNVLNGNAGSVTNATPTTPQTQQQQINGTNQIQNTPATMVSAIMQKI